MGQFRVQIMRQSGSVFGANQHGAICMQIAPCESDKSEKNQGLGRSDVCDGFLGNSIRYLQIRRGEKRSELLTRDANITAPFLTERYTRE